MSHDKIDAAWNSILASFLPGIILCPLKYFIQMILCSYSIFSPHDSLSCNFTQLSFFPREEEWNNYNIFRARKQKQNKRILIGILLQVNIIQVCLLQWTWWTLNWIRLKINWMGIHLFSWLWKWNYWIPRARSIISNVSIFSWLYKRINTLQLMVTDGNGSILVDCWLKLFSGCNDVDLLLPNPVWTGFKKNVY